MTQARKMTNARFFTRALPPVVKVFIFTLSFFSSAQPVKGNSVTCDVTSVKPLAKTSVTCHFSEDVNQTKKIVTISHFKGNNYQDEEDLLVCWWMSEIMSCDVKSGYKFNRIISRELKLEIPRVSTKHIGNYACKLSGMDPRDIKPCELKTTLGGRTMCDVPSIKDTSLTCYFPEDLSKAKANFSVYHYSKRGDKGDVMSCVWKGDNLYCKMYRSGYEFDYSVTDHAIIRIPSASEEHEGLYTCQITGLGSLRYDSCFLAFKKVVTTSSCQMPTVYEAEPAVLTCNFSADINATRKNISVVRFSGRNNKGVDITKCSWFKDKLNCTTAPGYEYHNTVRDHFIIKVPRASMDHNGTYACHVTGSKIEDFEPCDFIVRTGTPVLGIILGGIIPVIIAIFILIFILCYRKYKKNQNSPEVKRQQDLLKSENYWKEYVGS